MPQRLGLETVKIGGQQRAACKRLCRRTSSMHNIFEHDPELALLLD
jgi:hypothetical protein